MVVVVVGVVEGGSKWLCGWDYLQEDEQGKLNILALLQSSITAKGEVGKGFKIKGRE